MYHHRHGSSIPMLFSTPFDEAEVYPFAASSASVDCTLSLGTPSTRLVEDDERRVFHERRLSDGSCMTGFCLDLSQNGKQHPATTQKNVNNYNSGSGADPLLARRCANCDTTSTPLWRNGPRGPKSLCNACGIRFKKEERRAIAASDTPMSSAGPTAPLIMDPQQMINNSWIHNTDTQRMHCLSPAITNEFRFIEDNRYESDNTGYQFPPWRLNVTDRPGLVHDFTR